MGVVINFDSSQVAPSTGQLDAMPAGWYAVMMDESDMKPTKDGNGAYLQLRFDVIDGQYKGRKLYARLNIRNQNPQAVEIAYRDLAAICHAVGAVGMVQDTSMLHGRPLKVKVKVRAASAEYEASNEIGAYRNINDQTAVNTNTGMPAAMQGGGFPPPQQTAAPTWAPQQGSQPAPQQGYAPPQQPAQGQPTYQQPQQPQQPVQGQQWQQPQGGQPWPQPGQQPMQQPVPQGQPMSQPVQQPQQFAQPQGYVQPQGQQPSPGTFQPQPQGNPAANEPPPWAR